MDAGSTEKKIEAKDLQLVARHSHSWMPSTLDVENQAEVQTATTPQDRKGQELTPEAGPPPQDILQPPIPEQPVEGLAEAQPEISVSVPSTGTAVSAPLLHQESARPQVDVSPLSARNPEAKGSDPSSVWALVTALLVVAMLLALALFAGAQVSALGKSTTNDAKVHLAVGHPEAMCVPGMPADAAVSTNVQFGCYNPDNATGNCWYGDEELTRWVPKTTDRNGWPYPFLANSQASDVILALHCCGAVKYFYTPSNISTWAKQPTNNDQFSIPWGSQQLDQNTIDRDAACSRLARAKYCYESMSDASTVFINPYHDTINCSEVTRFALSHAYDNGSLTQFVSTTFAGTSPSIRYTFFTEKSVDAAKSASKSCYTETASLEAFKELHTVEGVLKIQTEADQVIWLGISQTPETARCMGTNSDTYAFWVRNIGCRWESSRDLSAGSAVWLMPTSFIQSQCSGGINLRYSDVYAKIQAAPQQNETKRFLLIRVNSNDDLFGIYTAILGALFGAVTILVASIIVVIIQRAMSKFAFCDASRAERNERAIP